MKKFILVLMMLLVACNNNQPQDNLEEFAQCITDEGAVMYGAFWCPHCNDNKNMFGEAVRFIEYVECDPRGPNSEAERCIEAGIDRYPTWTFGKEHKVTGALDFEMISKMTGCEMPQNG